MKYKGVLGALKDESLPDFIDEYVGLRAKMYSYVLASGGGDQKAKGVPKAAKKQLTHAAYRQALFQRAEPVVGFQRIASKRHKTHIVECQKRGINCYNDKVYQLSPYENRPLGHRTNADYKPVECPESLVFCQRPEGASCSAPEEVALLPSEPAEEPDLEEYQESSAGEESDEDVSAMSAGN